MHIGLPSLRLSTSGSLSAAIAAMFVNSEQGVWYDPSDFSSMYQDSTGVTPVTAVEQPVGLLLDKRYGLVRGAEVITAAADRDFSSDTGFWTKAAGATIAAGKCTLTVSGSITRTLLLTIGKTYEIVYDQTVRGGSVYIQNFFSQTNSGTSGAKRCILSVASGTLAFVGNGGATDVDIDNISVREIPGNHATQATAASRPVLSARYNLLTATHLLSGAGWTKRGTATVTSATAPDGTGETASVTTTGNDFYQSIASAGASVRNDPQIKIWPVSAVGLLRIDNAQGSANGRWVIDPSLLTADQWNTISRTHPAVSITTEFTTTAGGAGGISIYGATGAVVFYVKHPDLRLSADAALSIPAYQRVTDANTYDTAGFPWYLKADGVDDGMATAAIDFTGTDKMTVWAGVTKLSDAATGVFAELGTSSAVNGTIATYAPNGAATNFSLLSRGTASSTATATPFTSPSSVVLCGSADISNDLNVLRVLGTQAATAASDQGTGAYQNAPLYLFRRGGTTLPFNGRCYGLIVRGAASNATQITSGESFLKEKMKVVF
jgi:hypothetical protein